MSKKKESKTLSLDDKVEVNTQTGELTLQEKLLDKNLYAEDVKIKPVIRTQYNAPILPHHYEHNDQPSNTVPNQSMPLKTILDRFTRGLPLDIPLKNDYYEGENEEYIDMRHLDLAEQQELLEMSRQQTKDLEQRLKDQATKRKELQIETLRNRERKLREDLEKTKGQLSKQQQNPDLRFRNSDQGTTDPPSIS